ncbi:MAG: hypothetical protein KAT15_14970, partial [Bacteroidales bacterium]|nr:hypothetical protein [Bacteroidales bacterium]
MNKRIITFFLIFLAVVIAVIIARDIVSRNPRRSSGNPYKLDIDTFLRVDPSLIKYKEFRQIRLNLEEPAGIALLDGHIILVGDQKLMVISTEGKLISEFKLPNRPS